MADRNPRTGLETHQVTNQPYPFEDVNVYVLDRALREALQREGALRFPRTANSS